MDSPFRPAKARGFISSTELSMKQAAPGTPGPEARPRFQKVSLASRRLESAAASQGRDGSPSRVSMLLQAWEREIVEKTAARPSALLHRQRSSSINLLKDFTTHGPIFSQVYSPVQKPRRQDERGKAAAAGSARAAGSPRADGPGSAATPAGSPREIPVHRESYLHGALNAARPTDSPVAAPLGSSSSPAGSPRDGPGPAAASAAPVPGSPCRSDPGFRPAVPRARHVTVLRAGKEAAGSDPGLAEGRGTPNGSHEAPSVAAARAPGESCGQPGSDVPDAAVPAESSPTTSEAARLSAEGSQEEKCSTQAENMKANGCQRDGGRPGDLQASITRSQRCPSEEAGSQADGAAAEKESTTDGDSPASTTPPSTESSTAAGGTPENPSAEESNGPEPLPEAQEPLKEVEVEQEGGEAMRDPQGTAQEPESRTEPPPEPVASRQLVESPPDTAEEDLELVVDMELFVDTLRNMEPSEMRKAPKGPRQPRPSSLGRRAVLPPIHEDRVAPRAQRSLPAALRELLEQGDSAARQESPEEEVENPYLSWDEKPPAPAAPRRGVLRDGGLAKAELEMDSLLGVLRQAGAEEKAKVAIPRASLDHSMLFRGNVLTGTAPLPDFLEHRAAAADQGKPYSRLDNSVLYGRLVSPGTAPLEALEREGPSSPEPALPPGQPDQPCPNHRRGPEPCRDAAQETASPEDPSPGRVPPVAQEPAPKSALCPADRLQDDTETLKKINKRPGKIILFSESGFAGHKREIWGDVPDATSWELSHAVSIRVIRGGWVMYEKPRFHGRKCVLAEGDVEIDNPWTAYGQSGPPSRTGPFRIGSFKRVVRDYCVPEISLFAEENGEGARLTFTDSAEDTRTRGQALMASSVIVHSGLWLVYSKPFFDDDPYVLEPGGYPNLKAWGAKDPSICSMHPIRLGCPVVERPGEPQAVIYEDAGFQGRSLAVSRDIYDLRSLPGLPLPTVGSLHVLGGCWVGYEKEGFRGHQYLLEEGEYHDWTQWGGYNKELVSLRLIRTDFSNPALVLFEAVDFEEGPSVELREALPDTQLAGYGPVTQSIHVLSGVWVAYEGTNFSGEQYVLEKGVYRNCEDWGAADCRIASAQPILQVGEHNLHFVSKIQLFSEPDFFGDHISFEDDQDALPAAFVPHSCRVHGGSWTLFDGQAFAGEQHVLSEGEYPTLSAMGCLSSTVIRSLKKVPVFFSEPSIFLHGLECFEGKEIELNHEVRSLQAEGFNNHVLSVRVKGGIWVLCEHGDFRGRQWLLDCTEITNWLTYSGLQHVGSLYPIRQRRIYFRIRSKELERFLSVPDDAEDMKAGRVVVSSLSDQSSSTWYYEEGLIKNQVAPNMSLQVIGPAGKGAKAVLWSENRMPRQTWSIDSSGRIHSQMFEDMILDIKGGRTYDRDHAIIWDMAEERPTQIWDIQVL
ncbi:beta/gamma crystallin domain-containing protein 2 [Struthio camelus]|uniref:beta/gamma crystallin domain-containing protein 2 n=1 Tax=Struthio camelus TaxID=8801 RepID=UPI003603F5DF